MPARKTNEQKLTFTISKNSQGKMKINMAMRPKMCSNEEEFNKLPMYKREMQSTAANIVKFVMEALAEQEKHTQSSKSDHE